MDKMEELRNCVAAVDKDATKFFEANNKAAGTRARKHLQQLKTLAQELRVLIQSTKNEKQAEQHEQGGHADEGFAADPHMGAGHLQQYAHPGDDEGGY
ncbi:hypothetical protein I4F81_001095 [Pyropia yezoensis]|uniref:Uncharacterized protein n=1 Tax=Pyropia yezoensis TaxID=2788 RepID=A0ACC3BKL2_PYRYE|nr:hypothetical protein I4F81_001095 [Neopyropia yezoensis]